MRCIRRDATEAGEAAINKCQWLIWIKEIRDSTSIMRLNAPVEAQNE